MHRQPRQQVVHIVFGSGRWSAVEGFWEGSVEVFEILVRGRLRDVGRERAVCHQHLPPFGRGSFWHFDDAILSDESAAVMQGGAVRGERLALPWVVRVGAIDICRHMGMALPGEQMIT